MAEIGSYDLHLYCDDPAHKTPGLLQVVGLFSSRTVTDARKEAREAGWRMVRHSLFPVREGNTPCWLCPTCARTRFPESEPHE